MLRKTLLILLSLTFLGTASSLTACSDKAEVDPGPAKVQLPTGRAAVVGKWKSGTSLLVLENGGNFMWDMIKPCGAPPCAKQRLGGTWAHSGNSITLNLANGKSLPLTYKAMGPPRQLWIHNAMYKTKATYNLVN